jgi:hypothetical protein
MYVLALQRAAPVEPNNPIERPTPKIVPTIVWEPTHEGASSATVLSRLYATFPPFRALSSCNGAGNIPAPRDARGWLPRRNLEEASARIPL